MSHTRHGGSPWIRLACCTIVLLFGPATNLRAAVPTPEMQKSVRAATFEVVIPKPARDPLVYEKPLPLELIPFVQRNDAYWSIGSAFATAPNEFVSAAHVLLAGAARTAGPAALRDSTGAVYEIDRILKFSAAEDFVVFSLRKPPAGLQPLPTTDESRIDDVVFAAGNALGEGVIIRDGLLTSLTPEPRDGRWKYLRFSAAASPGNSGGPLLDAQGRALGVVVGKSDNENLNYALPLERVRTASSARASVLLHEPFSLPVLHDSTVVEHEGSFKLPATQAEFSAGMKQAFADWYRKAETQLLAEQAATVFPRGDADDFFAERYTRFDPTVLQQQDDRSWDLKGTGYSSETKLPGHGRVWISNDPRFTLFRLVFPDDRTHSKDLDDPKQLMDLLLKGLQLQRNVGTQPVRITSLGAPKSTESRSDAYGRAWQVHTWALEAIETELLVYVLPTPDGFAGFAAQYVPLQFDSTRMQSARLAEHFFISFTGTLPQWRAYLGRADQRARPFDRATLAYDATRGLALKLDELALQVPPSLLKFDDASRLDVRLSYVRHGAAAKWQPVGARLEPAVGKTEYIELLRQSKPGPETSQKVRSRWSDMVARTGDYSGRARRNDAGTEFWFRAVAVPARETDEYRYEVVFDTREPALPAVLEARRDLLLSKIQLLEP